MESKIRVACLFPQDSKLTIMTLEGSHLEGMQRLVDGYIEAIRLPNTKIILWVNEEGKILNLEPNCLLVSNKVDFQVLDCLVGVVVITSSDGEDIAGLSDEELEYLQANMRSLATPKHVVNKCLYFEGIS